MSSSKDQTINVDLHGHLSAIVKHMLVQSFQGRSGFGNMLLAFVELRVDRKPTLRLESRRLELTRICFTELGHNIWKILKASPAENLERVEIRVDWKPIFTRAT